MKYGRYERAARLSIACRNVLSVSRRRKKHRSSFLWDLEREREAGWTRLLFQRPSWLARGDSEPQGGIRWETTPTPFPKQAFEDPRACVFFIFLPWMDDPRAPATVSMKSPGGPGACISTSDREDQKVPACRQGESAQTTESPTAEELGSDRRPEAGPTG